MWISDDLLADSSAIDQSTDFQKESDSSSNSSRQRPTASRHPNLHNPGILEKKRWHSLTMMERKENTALANLVCLPPDLSGTCRGLILDSIIDIDGRAHSETLSKTEASKVQERLPKH